MVTEGCFAITLLRLLVHLMAMRNHRDALLLYHPTQMLEAWPQDLRVFAQAREKRSPRHRYAAAVSGAQRCIPVVVSMSNAALALEP